MASSKLPSMMMLAVILLMMITASAVLAQSPKTVLDGAYTEAQSLRGETEYFNQCARCHGERLGGGGAAPMLHTGEFLDRWREDYLSSLFQFLQKRMPPRRGAGGLSEQQYLDILSFLLYENELPAGSHELTAADLDTTILVGPDGPKPLPPAATVRVVGCLARPDGAWTLSRSTPPARVQNGTDTDSDELEKSAHAQLGAQQFRLPNLDEDHKESELTPLVGKKVQIKGVLNGQGSSARVSVLSFKPLGQDCGQ